jgi:hypothetical protein
MWDIHAQIMIPNAGNAENTENNVIRTWLLTEATIEREYGIPASTLRKRRFLGLAPRFIKIGRSVYYFRVDFEAWIESLRNSGDRGVA